MTREEQVLACLSQVQDPDLGRDIVSLNFVKNLRIDQDGKVWFVLELTTPACPLRSRFQEECRRLLLAIDWVTGVEVTISARPNQVRDGDADGLKKVAHLLAVFSCKGGVGKSTVAVNLAFALKQQGARVGIFDADIYGPSLPTMVSAPSRGLRQKGELIEPIYYGEMPLMSFAYAATDPDAPAVMRGPMVSNLIRQLFTQTDWGELDYLIVDMPPGTGDIQLTLAQIAPFTAAVMVTTPQNISFIDVAKGIRMFDKVEIPTIAVVENMSCFVCPDCGGVHEIFGRGAARKLKEQFGFEQPFSLPIDPAVASCGDTGSPIVATQPESETAKRYGELAAELVREVSRIAYGDKATVALRVDPKQGLVFSRGGKEQRVWSAFELRRACRCALCVDERTGEPLPALDAIPADVTPGEIAPLGNYAFTVEWSDGHHSIYPHQALGRE